MISGTEVKYKCACMAKEATVYVPYRNEGECVGHWVEYVMGPTLALDHRKQSPTCMRTEMEYAQIEAPESAPYLGGRPVLS